MEKMYQRPKKPSMLRRSYQWDYCAPAIYMITLTLEDRSKPLLGKVMIDCRTAEPWMVRAHLEPSELGRAVFALWRQLGQSYPEVEPLYLQLMEEHLHGILRVKAAMGQPLGRVVAAFKAQCTHACQSLCGGEGGLFSRGFQDTILRHRGQLDRMFHYLKDNPRRLAVKRLFPEFFQRLQTIPFSGGHLTGFGNPFLLEASRFHQIQASRRATPEEMKRLGEELYKKILEKAVVVSPCISEGERELARLAFEARVPLIVLKANGFSPFYKPSGALFEACAEGRLLMLAPPGYGIQRGHRQMSRNEACVLNRIAQLICGIDAADIHYAGNTPVELEALVAQAIERR